MIEAYRLHRSQYAASDGTGSAKAGASPKGVEVVYGSSSPSLAVLEILVNYDGLPSDFVLTLIVIPDGVSIAEVPASILAKGWDLPVETSATQQYGKTWIACLCRIESPLSNGATRLQLRHKHESSALPADPVWAVRVVPI